MASVDIDRIRMMSEMLLRSSAVFSLAVIFRVGEHMHRHPSAGINKHIPIWKDTSTTQRKCRQYQKSA